MVACVDSSTLEVPMSVHLERFWEVMPVEPLDVPQGLVEAGMQRLQGGLQQASSLEVVRRPPQASVEVHTRVHAGLRHDDQATR